MGGGEVWLGMHTPDQKHLCLKYFNFLQELRFLSVLLWNKQGPFFRKIPTPIQIPPPFLKKRTLWAWRFSFAERAKMPGAHKIGATISGPRIVGEEMADIRFSSEFCISSGWISVLRWPLKTLLSVLFRPRTKHYNSVDGRCQVWSCRPLNLMQLHSFLGGDASLSHPTDVGCIWCMDARDAFFHKLLQKALLSRRFWGVPNPFKIRESSSQRVVQAEAEGWFYKRAVLANRPSFGSWGPGMSKILALFCQCSIAGKDFLEEMSVHGEHLPNPPFWKPPFFWRTTKWFYGSKSAQRNYPRNKSS